MARKLLSATIKAMQRVCENVTLFDVDIYFDDNYAEIVIYDDMCREIHRACVNGNAELQDVLYRWQHEYEGFIFDYAESERPERAISQQVNDIKIKMAYANATRFLDEAVTPLDFENAYLHLLAAEDLQWLQWQECN